MARIIDFDEYRKHNRLRQPIKIIKMPPETRRKKYKKPDRQGHLDSLCGVYSIINAVNAVYRLSESEREKLFKRLIARLGKDKHVAKALVGGTSKKHLEAMLDEAIDYVSERHGVTLAVKPLFRRGVDMCLTLYWHTVFQFLHATKKRSVIIGINGRDDHWTCVRAMSHYSMKLLDSSGAKRLRRRLCRIGKPYSHKWYHLIPTQAWGISLKKD
jgi:hypothetical protein